jgi:hypothetical protein
MSHNIHFMAVLEQWHVTATSLIILHGHVCIKTGHTQVAHALNLAPQIEDL